MSSLYILPILLFFIVVHEVAHGWIALRLGDSTAYDFGRQTLDPIPHIDPIGSIVVPLLSYISAGSVFISWAKRTVPANRVLRNNSDHYINAIRPFKNFIFMVVTTVRIPYEIFGNQFLSPV